MNSHLKTKLVQAIRSMPLRIALAAMVFAAAYGAQHFFHQNEEMPAPYATGTGASMDALFPEQTDAVIKFRIEQQRQQEQSVNLPK